jgi:phosphohistidine phosphatase SixA
VAKGVAEIGAVPDLILSSPYLRAVQTAEIFASALEQNKQKIRKTDLLLPGADPMQLFRELAREKQASAVFIFGHAPQQADLAIGLAQQQGTTLGG